MQLRDFLWAPRCLKCASVPPFLSISLSPPPSLYPVFISRCAVKRCCMARNHSISPRPERVCVCSATDGRRSCSREPLRLNWSAVETGARNGERALQPRAASLSPASRLHLASPRQKWNSEPAEPTGCSDRRAFNRKQINKKKYTQPRERANSGGAAV